MAKTMKTVAVQNRKWRDEAAAAAETAEATEREREGKKSLKMPCILYSWVNWDGAEDGAGAYTRARLQNIQQNH